MSTSIVSKAFLGGFENLPSYELCDSLDDVCDQFNVASTGKQTTSQVKKECVPDSVIQTGNNGLRHQID